MGLKYFATSFASISPGIWMRFGLMPVAQSLNFSANSFHVMGLPFPILGNSVYKGVTNHTGLKLPFKPNSNFILLLKAQGGGGSKKGTSCELGSVIFSKNLQIIKLA
jgi:hypothetical protein